MIDQFKKERLKMVEDQLRARGITDERVLEVMSEVPRHEFVPDHISQMAYLDRALPLGFEQTISQPYIVALMLQSLAVSSESRVLEIGTGSGYQTALLSALGAQVYTIESSEHRFHEAFEVLSHLGYSTGRVRGWCGDGYQGWPQEAPFDRIIVTAAAPEIPRELVRELKEGGRMVLPIGADEQCLVLVEKAHDGTLSSSELGEVRFVPMKAGR